VVEPIEDRHQRIAEANGRGVWGFQVDRVIR
jgi:hypothetical protein